MQEDVFTNLKSQIRAMPVVGDVLARALRIVGPKKFQSSEQYWRDRYEAGGNSGSGSYGPLSKFKADVINGLVADLEVSSVVELGTGDGAQLELLSIPAYTGVDISSKVIETAREKHAQDTSKDFVTLSEFNISQRRFDAAMSLDVIYHLVEDSVFDQHMTQLFGAAEKLVIIYASNKDGRTGDPHVRHRMFTRWVQQNAVNWKLVEKIDNPFPFDWKNPRETSFADFYIYQKL